MSDIVEAAEEAVRVAKGETPAARIYHQGHFYVPQTEFTRLTAEVERLRAALEGMIELCMHAKPDAFRNGVTDSTGTVDEGDVIAIRIIDTARAALQPPAQEKSV